MLHESRHLYRLVRVVGDPGSLPGLVRPPAPHFHAGGAVTQRLGAARGPHVGGQRQEVDKVIEISLIDVGDRGPRQLLADVDTLSEGEGLGNHEVAGVPGPHVADVPLHIQHLRHRPVPGGPEAPGLPVPANDVSLCERPGDNSFQMMYSY